MLLSNFFLHYFVTADHALHTHTLIWHRCVSSLTHISCAIDPCQPLCGDLFNRYIEAFAGSAQNSSLKPAVYSIVDACSSIVRITRSAYEFMCLPFVAVVKFVISTS